MDPADATVRQCVVRIDDRAASLRLVAGRPVLWWKLRELSRFGVTDFLLPTGPIPDWSEASLPRPVRVRLSEPRAGAASGGALFDLVDQLADRFLVCGGDMLFDWNLSELLADAATDGPGIIGRAVRFADAPRAGIALFHRVLVDRLRPVCSLEAEVLPDLVRHGKVRVSTVNHAAAGRGSVSAEACAAGLRRKALFLDRDGVLNHDYGYIGSRERFEWVDGALEAVRYATGAGWHVFIVTNQSGVARGLYPEAAVAELLAWIAGQARAAGGTIDDARFCPFHPDATLDAYRQAHPWRKPLPGMLLDLIRAWELDPKRAVMVGDQETDMAAAAAAGVAGHLFRGGNLLRFLRPILDGSGVP